MLLSFHFLKAKMYFVKIGKDFMWDVTKKELIFFFTS